MTEQELSNLFEARKPMLKTLGDWVVEYIVTELAKKLGSRENVDVFFQIPPKPRVKQTDSFLEKALLRKPKKEPLLEITDQIGVRFVVLRLEDISQVGSIVESGPWEYSKDRDHEKERQENPNYFAYQSDHYIIKTKTEINFKNSIIPAHVPCEIQIRTILQHAYAEMAYKTDYKPSIRIPDIEQRKVKRALAKGSALIETTDDVFGEIQKYIREYSKSSNALLVSASSIYKTLLDKETNPETILGTLIADTYREDLKTLTPKMLHEWVNSNTTLGSILKDKYTKSVFYRDSVIILVAWLISEFSIKTPKTWPVDVTHLQDLYLALGISTDGLF